MRSILEAAGQHVHVYTSPHLVRFNERFRIAAEGGSKLVGDDELRATLGGMRTHQCRRADHRVRDHDRGGPAAVLAPSGRCRCCSKSALAAGSTPPMSSMRRCCSVITPVSLDHADYLGDSIESVATEKAGIIKRGVRAVIGPQMPEALSIMERTAQRVRAPLPGRRRTLECERRTSPSCLSG